jgi:hypothetical protein
MNESRQEERFQPVNHEEASSRHHADEEPTITEDALFAQSAGPKGVSMPKSMSFDDEDDDEIDS